jgi:aryl-alcohol dehydrogenase-like predicted oxidoreductase
MEFSGGGYGMMSSAFPKISQEEKNAIVNAALKYGINWFDTAELYGGGFSEAGLAAALKAAGKSNQDVVVATKWWPILRSASNIAHTISERIRFLDGYTIGLYMVHQPFSFSSIEAEMAAMAALVKAGNIRSVGVSNFSAKQMRRAH